MIKKSLFSVFTGCIALTIQAQTVYPNLQDLDKWMVINRSVEAVNEDGKKAVRFKAHEGEGFLILKEIEFANGTIEFDVKGRNLVQQSFVGFAFHGVDEKTYEAVYFRPFNFSNADTARRRRAVQYISMPDYPWEKLRQDSPGKYENKVDPAPDPDNWFHVKIVVQAKHIAVYVNNEATPSLEVVSLSSTAKGGVALWLGNNSGGSFANLSITSSAP